MSTARPAAAHVLTLGDLIARGNSHLEVRCLDCERCTLFPLRTAPWPCGQPVMEMAAKFFCERCGTRNAGVRGMTPEQPKTERLWAHQPCWPTGALADVGAGQDLSHADTGARGGDLAGLPQRRADDVP